MDVNSSSPARTPKLQPAAEEPLTGECWIPPKKYTSGPRAKEKPQQDGRRGKVTFRIKPHTQQRRLKGSNKTLCAPGHSTETEPELHLRVWVSPVEVRVSSGLLQGSGLWVQQTWVWHKPSWRRLPSTHHRATRNYTGLGNQTLGGHKQNRVCTWTQEKGAVTPQETGPDLPWVSRSLQQRPGLAVVQAWGH